MIVLRDVPATADSPNLVQWVSSDYVIYASGACDFLLTPQMKRRLTPKPAKVRPIGRFAR